MLRARKDRPPRPLQAAFKSEMKVILLLFTNTAVIFAQTMIKEEKVRNLVTDLGAKVSTGTTVNGHPLNANVSVTKGDVGLGNVNNTAQEPALGNPASDGYILSSTAMGVRSWVAPGGGGGMIPMGYLDTDSSLGADSDAKIASQKAIRSYVDRALGSKAASNASTSVNGQPCALGGSCTVADTTKVPTTRQVNGHALSVDVTVTKADVGLGNVVNMAQEAALGNPASDGYVLSSTAAGVRSWVAPTGGGGVPYTGASGDVDLGTHKITSGQFVSSDTTDTSLIVLKPGASSGFPSGMDVPSGDYGIYVNASNKPVFRSSAPADLIIPTAYADLVAMFGGGACSGYLKNDGTCGTPGGTSVNVNGSSVSSPNFNGTTPAAQTNNVNVIFQVSGSSVSAEVPTGNTASTVAAGNDSRLSDARTPVAPTSSTLGGTKSIDCTGTGHLYKIDTTGTPYCSADTGSSSGSGVGRTSLTATWTAISDGACQEQTATWTGVTTGSTVQVGLPAALAGGLFANVRVSASDTVAIRLCNLSGASVTPGGQTFSAVLLTYGLTGSATATAMGLGAIADGTCTSGTFTLTGAVAGDPVVPQWPASLETGLFGSMLASAANTVQVRLCNFSGASVMPTGSESFGAQVAK